ncbi:hypothetical protein MGA5115_01232 [Marinomonas gallaica]|uniref:Uridine kinase n=1 Tax=Marinomonas gallaica TaxID=1806667 RepID=A0A1C3JPQ7_9GAMM|nr:uridine kinase [Marinomonas gallaica]SBT17142.1 hypothetical protein MGA5115_01232 [Marinomonas gallaica]SBT19477.1 hypothetical protein MGA5116_00031 [Marinomonas gallaica]
MYLNNLGFKRVCIAFAVLGSFASVAEDLAQADSAEVVEEVQPAAPSYSKGAELFGIGFNNLSKAEFEAHLSKMGLEPYPSYREGIASYSLGATGILGIKELTVVYNHYEYVERATMSGVVEDPELRSKLGSVLERKYGPPTVGFIRDGYGRARWILRDGTEIELHNTTFDVSVSYLDRIPKRKSSSGRIDVEALLKRNQ